MPSFSPKDQQPARFPVNASAHHERVKNAIPAWLLSASASRVAALKTAKVTIPDWHRLASAEARQQLKNDLQLAWKTQNDVDRTLSALQDVKAFAKPLLQNALRSRFGLGEDIEEIWLRLYAPAKTPWWVHDFSSGTQSRTVSLLDAALHNFASNETYTADSQFITRPDARGHFAVKRLEHKISIDQFISLCRELDIGEQYQRHLNEYLLSSNSVAGNVLRHYVIQSQKSAFGLAARMALMTNDIDQDAHDVVLGMLQQHQNLQWKGRPVSFYTLSMLDAALTGIVVIAPDLFSNTTVPLIVYIPHDPEHPLKQYPSSQAFLAELTRQLRDIQPGIRYQQFFSQFVPHQQRGHFFAGLNDRLSKMKWQPVPAGSQLPTWRETPVDKPDLQLRPLNIQDDRETHFTGDLWGYFYKQTLNKIFNDAREIAITTAYADRMVRWAWWDNLEKMLSDILNVALLVVTPIVPGLGELMLAYTAYQLTDEVVEGVVDLAQGRLAEAGEQIIGVLESIVQLGAFAAGGAIANAGNAKLSPFFEGLKPVQSADGQTRLWNPDLTPYQRPDLALPPETRPDGSGIYQHQGQSIVRLDDQFFEVEKDPADGQHRIKHPHRPDAYAPTLAHNGHGAWVSETETPRDWEGPVLMRRLGHVSDGFNDRQLEQVRQISGTDTAELRRMHVESAPPPPLLTDTLQRLGASGGTSTASNPEITALFGDFPELPETVAEKVVASASDSEREQIKQKKRLPLRLKSQARELQFETQSVRAAHGLYNDALINLDTERLVLGTLRVNTDTFGELRIEIREGTFDGELRSSAGPEDAEQLRVLIRDETGQYQVRDGTDQPIHEADDFLNALLHALGKDGQKALGYQPGDVDFFRQWIIVKTAAPAERRTILAQPPIRTVAERETQLLVRGGFLSKDGATVQERIQDMHPHFSEEEINAFADALDAKGNALEDIKQQEKDLKEVRGIIDRWQYQQLNGWGPGIHEFRSGGGLHIAERIVDCFERKNGDLGNRTDPDSYSLDLSRELLPLNVQKWWSKLPPELNRYLEKVTVLKLDNTRFSGQLRGLLKDFPNLRELSAKRCDLVRLPKRVGGMHRLERLQLSDNLIVLDATAVEQISHLTYLEILRLEDNPLGTPINIGRMPRLKVVALRNTATTIWPEGTFDKPRPRGFLLDLRQNRIDRVPQVVPGSPNAFVVARTRVDVGNLSEVDRMIYQDLRRSMALPPEPLTPPSSHTPEFIANYTRENWTDVPGWGVDRANLWSDLVDEPQAERFMSVLIDTQQSADYRAGGEARSQLLQRVWRMLDAVHIDTPLREKLFTMAIAPVNCEDAGAQLFNHMGIQVLASEAHSYSTNPAQLEQRLVTLAKGAARLEQVNEIARADMAARGGNPDEVEVYLAYQTGLARRLNLPWQSEGMHYREVSGVTDEMIDQAYDTVLALGEGDGLVNRMLEQDFWEDYLRKTWPVRMETNKRTYLAKYEQLETLRATQREWSDSAQLTMTQRNELKAQLTALLDGLPVSRSEVFIDTPISDQRFDLWLIELGENEKQLARDLTRASLRKTTQ